MADDYASAAMAALRAALIGDEGVAALVGPRVVDQPAETLPRPYVRFGRIELVKDDTDGTQARKVQVGLVVVSGDGFGRTDAARICGAIENAVHAQPEKLDAPGYAVTEVDVQTWVVEPRAKEEVYEARLALEVHLDALT